MKDTVFEFAKQSPVDIFMTEDGRKLMRYTSMPSHDITWYIDKGEGNGWERMNLTNEMWYSLNTGAHNYERQHLFSIPSESVCNYCD